MKSIRQMVSCLCLATTLSASAPCLAESREASGASKTGNAPIVQAASKLDLSGLWRAAVWSGPSRASSQAPAPLKTRMQMSNGGGSGMSTAKKTWIIVGSVVGGAMLVGALSHHGGGSGGGGGY
jgi:hypothetical protein